MGMYNKLPCWSSILGYSWANLRKLKNINITIKKKKKRQTKNLKKPKDQNEVQFHDNSILYVQQENFSML